MSTLIGELLLHGLLQGSFVPPEPIRERRDFIRYRAILRQETTDVANRIQKALENPLEDESPEAS